MYKSEQELIDAGFLLSPQPIHDGKGIGKLYEKVESNQRVYFVVEADGAVVPHKSNFDMPGYFGGEPKEFETTEVVEPPKPRGKKVKV